MIFLFFFFQAEDGIRDRDVTGVQTCALPILPMIDKVRKVYDVFDKMHLADVADEIKNQVKRSNKHKTHRSEERRVGKSVDLGGRRISKKKKKKKKRKQKREEHKTKIDSIQMQ